MILKNDKANDIRTNVLIIGPLPPQVGGIESYLGYLLKTKLTQKYHIRVLNISKPAINSSKKSFASLSGYDRCFKRGWRILAQSYLYSMYFFMRYLWELLSHPVDYVHIHTASYTSFWEKCAYISAGKLFRKKVLIHIHGSRFADFYRASSSPAQRLIRTFLMRCDRIIVLSRSWARFFIEFLPAEQVKIVENGIDLTDYASNSFTKTEHPSLSYLGEVGVRKGIFDLIAAVALLRRQGFDLQVLVIGPGEIEKARREARKSGVDDLFHFLGPLYNRPKVKALASAWGFVLPTYAEGMPLSILEAFAAGLPVISTPVGGIPEVVRENENGYIVKPGDPATLARAVQKLFADERARSGMASLNRLQAFEKYDIHACADRIDMIYRELDESARVQTKQHPMKNIPVSLE